MAGRSKEIPCSYSLALLRVVGKGIALNSLLLWTEKPVFSLNAPDTPSVLFETGYLSNASDVSFLASSTGRQKVARAVANAIQVHFARRIVTR
ncbi:N-acetylmuramoyl-L-alanine amidase family protein [Sphingorhabdus sp.]|uniref:N-acetylmuramoyl-L-alanine amidase family protein n=2 Tax=Sphingorhabdus sp. TaxID=1902408 RepID=UPI002FD9AAAC